MSNGTENTNPENDRNSENDRKICDYHSGQKVATATEVRKFATAKPRVKNFVCCKVCDWNSVKIVWCDMFFRQHFRLPMVAKL